jgi:selenium metabolism protein YedF
MSKTMPSESVNQACCAAVGRSVPKSASPFGEKTLVLLATDSLGKGNEDLGRIILINFIRTVKEMGSDLWRLVLLNSGVKLAVEGSEALPYLQELAHEGLGILVCGPCLKTFNLFEKKQVGEITNMLDIVTSMQLAEKIITLS